MGTEKLPRSVVSFLESVTLNHQKYFLGMLPLKKSPHNKKGKQSVLGRFLGLGAVRTPVFNFFLSILSPVRTQKYGF